MSDKFYVGTFSSTYQASELSFNGFTFTGSAATSLQDAEWTKSGSDVKYKWTSDGYLTATAIS